MKKDQNVIMNNINISGDTSMNKIEEFNYALLEAVYNGDSYSIGKLLESEEVSEWFDSEYIRTDNPSLNPIIAAIAHIDGKNCFKEFLLRFEDLISWEFGHLTNPKSLLSIAIEMQNIEILSYIKNNHPNSWLEINRKNSYNMTPINYLGLSDSEFFKEFLDLIEEDREKFIIENNNRILTSMIHRYFNSGESLENIISHVKNYIEFGIDLNADNDRFLKTVDYYVKQDLENIIVNKVVQIDPIVEVIKKINKEQSVLLPTLYEKIENLNKIYNDSVKEQHNLDYNLGFMTSFNLKNFSVINNSDLVKSRNDFHQGMLAGIKNKFKTSLLTDNIDFKQLYEIKNNPGYVNFLSSKVSLNNDPLFKDFLSSFINNYKREYIDIFREKYEIINSMKNTDLIVENIKKPRL